MCHAPFTKMGFGCQCVSQRNGYTLPQKKRSFARGVAFATMTRMPHIASPAGILFTRNMTGIRTGPLLEIQIIVLNFQFLSRPDIIQWVRWLKIKDYIQHSKKHGVTVNAVTFIIIWATFTFHF